MPSRRPIGCPTIRCAIGGPFRGEDSADAGKRQGALEVGESRGRGERADRRGPSSTGTAERDQRAGNSAGETPLLSGVRSTTVSFDGSTTTRVSQSRVSPLLATRSQAPAGILESVYGWPSMMWSGYRLPFVVSSAPVSPMLRRTLDCAVMPGQLVTPRTVPYGTPLISSSPVLTP